MNHLRRVAAPAYFLALILVLSTGLDLVQSIWPLRIGDVQWRVLSIGLMSRMLIPPLLGLVLAYVAALLAEHRGVLRTLAVVDGLLALGLLAGLGFYALDALELRARLAQGNQNYDLGISFSFVKYLLGFALLVWLTIGQWRSASGMRKGGRRQAAEPATAVVFARGDKADKAGGAPAAAPDQTAPSKATAPPETEPAGER